MTYADPASTVARGRVDQSDVTYAPRSRLDSCRREAGCPRAPLTASSSGIGEHRLTRRTSTDVRRSDVLGAVLPDAAPRVAAGLRLDGSGLVAGDPRRRRSRRRRARQPDPRVVTSRCYHRRLRWTPGALRGTRRWTRTARRNRNVEYDAFDDRYVGFLVDEIAAGGLALVDHRGPRPSGHLWRQQRRQLRLHRCLAATPTASAGSSAACPASRRCPTAIPIPP